MKNMKKQTLRDAVRSARDGSSGVGRCGLAGCPVGGWPQTDQAMRRMSDEIPSREHRTYSILDLINALYRVAAGRYQWRDET